MCAPKYLGIIKATDSLTLYTLPQKKCFLKNSEWTIITKEWEQRGAACRLASSFWGAEMCVFTAGILCNLLPVCLLPGLPVSLQGLQEKTQSPGVYWPVLPATGQMPEWGSFRFQVPQIQLLQVARPMGLSRGDPLCPFKVNQRGYWRPVRLNELPCKSGEIVYGCCYI